MFLGRKNQTLGEGYDLTEVDSEYNARPTMYTHSILSPVTFLKVQFSLCTLSTVYTANSAIDTKVRSLTKFKLRSR